MPVVLVSLHIHAATSAFGIVALGLLAGIDDLSRCNGSNWL